MLYLGVYHIIFYLYQFRSSNFTNEPLKYKEISKYPSINKDLAFIVKKDVSSNEISEVIKKSAGRLLTNIEVFDVYTKEKVESDEKSIAYALTFNDPTKTITEEEVNTLFEKIIKDVESKLNAKLRNM